MNRDLIPQVEPLVDHLNTWVGQLIEVLEAISRVPGTFDRHFATSSHFVMRLRGVGVTFSGTSLTISGEAGDQPAQYQATFDRLESLSIQPRVVLFLERFGHVAERRSVFRLLDGNSTPSEPRP